MESWFYLLLQDHGLPWNNSLLYHLLLRVPGKFYMYSQIRPLLPPLLPQLPQWGPQSARPGGTDGSNSSAMQDLLRGTRSNIASAFLLHVLSGMTLSYFTQSPLPPQNQKWVPKIGPEIALSGSLQTVSRKPLLSDNQCWIITKSSLPYQRPLPKRFLSALKR